MIAYLSIFLRLAKSSMRLRHSCHCLCASDFHGIRLCLSYGTSDSALCLPFMSVSVGLRVLFRACGLSACACACVSGHELTVPKPSYRVQSHACA